MSKALESALLAVSRMKGDSDVLAVELNRMLVAARDGQPDEDDDAEPRGH